MPEGRSSAHQEEGLTGCLKLIRKRKIEEKVLQELCEIQGIRCHFIGSSRRVTK